MGNYTDTIAAIATAVGSSGIGIVRVSGQEAFSVAGKIFLKGGKQNCDLGTEENDHRVLYGHIYDGDEMVDEVLVLVMRGPHSYTGEDTVEIGDEADFGDCDKIWGEASGAGGVF